MPHASWSRVPASHFEACVAGCALVWPLESRTDLVSSDIGDGPSANELPSGELT